MGRSGVIALLALLAILAGCAGDAGTNGGDVGPDAGPAPYSDVTTETYRDHVRALEDAGSYALVLTADVPLDAVGTARLTRTYAVDRGADRYLETSVTEARGRELASSALYAPSLTRTTGHHRTSGLGQTRVEAVTVNGSARIASHPIPTLVTALDYGPPEATTLNGSTAYRYEAKDPDLTVNVTGRGGVRDAALYLRPDGAIARLAFTLETEGRTLDLAYAYRDVGSTEVETPDWVPK